MQRAFSILGLQVVIAADEPAWLERLDDITTRTGDGLPPTNRTIHLRLTRADDGIHIEQDGRVCAQAEDFDLAIRELHLHLNQLALEAQPETLKLHAAAGTWQDQFFLVTGDRGAGKTTLMLKLMLNGAAMHCDDIVLLRDGLIQTFPRKFYIKAGTLACLPRVAEVCAAKRPYPGFFGGQLYFADPSDFGRPWISREGRPATVFHLTPTFDRPPRVEPCAKVDMVRHLLLQTINMTGDLGRHVAALCPVVDACRCYSLRVGGLEATAALVEQTLADGTIRT